MSNGRRSRGLALLALTCAAALPIAACSSGSSGRPVASLPGHPGSSSTPGALTSAQGDRDFVNFARCMRAHGVQMSDPFHRPGHSGLSISLPPHNSATDAAWGACNHFMARTEQLKASAGASRAVANLPALTRWAQCMRSHDIPMLDPTADGQLSLGTVPGINSDFGRYSPQFRAADHACRYLLPAGVNDDGTGP